MWKSKKIYKNSREHLAEELVLMEMRIKKQIAVMNLANPSTNQFDEFSGMYISKEEINRYLDCPDHPDQTKDLEIHNHKTIKTITHKINKYREYINQRIDITREKGVNLRVLELVARFQLTNTGLEILICCLAPDIDSRFERYFAYLQNDISKRRPSIKLLSRMFLEKSDPQPEAGRDALFKARELFNPASGLLDKSLFIVHPGSSDGEIPFPAQQPFVAASVIDFLLETEHLDTSLEGIALLKQSREMEMNTGYHGHHLQILEKILHTYHSHHKIPPMYIGGPAGAGKTSLVETIAAVIDKNVLKVNTSAMMESNTDIHQLLAVIEREARLHSCILHFDISSQDYVGWPEGSSQKKPKTRVFNDFLQERHLPAVIITGTNDYHRIKDNMGPGLLSFFIPMPTMEERHEIWSCLLNFSAVENEEELITGLAVKFRFTPGQIQTVLNSAALAAGNNKDSQPVLQLEDIYRCCREESNQGLLSYSQKIIPKYKWQDIILPMDTLNQLKEICVSIKNREKVFGEWGFDSKFSIGKGLNILFSGPPGIGKTMSAEIIANDLGLDLYKIDLSFVVSKYIGETEKNLNKIFKEAETSNCILFFDEADALFGKRTEVKDSHDRYANIEINFLLQKLDEYEGIVLLATNMKKNLDLAFTRRLHHVVEFPFPDETYRELIWRNIFPAAAPKAGDIDYSFLAGKFKIAGGNIKNIAINSAFLASTNGGNVNMENIILAIKREYQKMGKMCSKSDFGPYHSLVREKEAGET